MRFFVPALKLRASDNTLHCRPRYWTPGPESPALDITVLSLSVPTREHFGRPAPRRDWRGLVWKRQPADERGQRSEPVPWFVSATSSPSPPPLLGGGEASDCCRPWTRAAASRRPRPRSAARHLYYKLSTPVYRPRILFLSPLPLCLSQSKFINATRPSGCWLRSPGCCFIGLNSLACHGAPLLIAVFNVC